MIYPKPYSIYFRGTITSLKLTQGLGFRDSGLGIRLYGCSKGPCEDPLKGNLTKTAAYLTAIVGTGILNKYLM